MARDERAAYLELKVGRFRLALNTDRVAAVLGDVPRAETVRVHDAPVPFADLLVTFGGSERAVAPFAVVIEVETARVALGVDRVDHLHFAAPPLLVPLPRFGLRVPALFAGVLRDGRGLLLTLEPSACIALTTRKKFTI